MPSRCSTLKGKVSSRLICKSPLSSILVFPFSKASGTEGTGVGSGRVAAQSPLPRTQPGSAIARCPFPSLRRSAPTSVRKCTGSMRSPGRASQGRGGG